MSDKITVKFKESGKWSDNPADPIFEVEAGDEVDVSASFANMLVAAKKGKIVKKKAKKTEDENKDTLVEGEVCTLDDGTEGTVEDGECVANEDDDPKEGDKCTLDNGKDGVIKDGKCVKKGFLG